MLYGSETCPIDDVEKLEHTGKGYGEVAVQCCCNRWPNKWEIGRLALWLPRLESFCLQVRNGHRGHGLHQTPTTIWRA